MRAKTYPATYPNGWYKIAESSEIPIGTVIEAQAVGKVFAVFRGEDGKVGILDAYCVHLGANMAVGGKVVGNCLVRSLRLVSCSYRILCCVHESHCIQECPFHKWRFDSQGKCTHIPYSEKVTFSPFFPLTLIPLTINSSRLTPDP
jgi:phenylpropionate dioxygenase-like ring-hydroxylating dioxygenase large terminal subunit